MAGLGAMLEQQPAPAMPAPAGAMPQGAPMAENPNAMMKQGEPASPKEQQQYETFVSLAILAIYDKKSGPKTVDFLRNATDPVTAVATVSSGIAMRVYQNAKDNNQEISGDVILHAGKEIVETVIDLAERVTGKQFDDAMMEKAFYAAADMFAAEMKRAGVYTDQVAAEDAASLTAMRDSGQLAAITGGQKPTVMPGQEQAAPAAPAGPQTGAM